MKEKILEYKEARKLQDVKAIKVLVGGCFDLVHLGHIRFLKEAKKRGDLLIVALESDQFIEKQKGRKPIHSQSERAEILTALNQVDFVVKLPFFESYQDYLGLVKEVKPDIIAVTRGDPQIENKKKQAEAIKARVEEVTPYIEGKSTSALVEKSSS